MAEAAELGHWEIVRKMGETVGESSVTELADWAVDVQRGHVEAVRESCLAPGGQRGECLTGGAAARWPPPWQRRASCRS